KDVVVSHKSKQQAPPTDPRDRFERARREGRFQQALEQARLLYKQDPSEANLELLRESTLARGQQLLSQGTLKEAAVVFGNAFDLGGDAAFRETLAEKLAACGDLVRANAVLQQLPDGPARARVLGQAVDAALRKGAAGRAQLAADQQAGFDLVLQAFAHAEAG